MAKVLSRYLNKEFEVASYESQENGDVVQVISHEALEDIIHNQISADVGVRYDFTDMQISRAHCVIRCTVSDTAGRRVQAIGETVPETLETEISQNYPALMASQRAFDRAVIRYLNLPGKTLSNLENPNSGAVDNGETKVSLDDIEPSEAPVKAAAAAREDNTDTKPTDAPVNNAASKVSQAPVEPNKKPAPTQQPTTAPAPAQKAAAQAAKNDPVVAAANSLDGPGSVICDVGRYRQNPKTVADIYVEDRSYISWLTSDRYTATTEKAKGLKRACSEYLQIMEKGGK